MGNSLAVRDSNQLRSWVERIRQCESSGKQVIQWCNENSINTKSYYYWHSKISKLASADNIAEKQPEVFCEIGSRYHDTGIIAASIHIREDTVDIYSGADEETIMAILRAVRTC